MSAPMGGPMTTIIGDPDTGNPHVFAATLSGAPQDVVGIQVGLILTGDHNVNGAYAFVELLPPGKDHSPTSTDWFDVNGSFPDPHASAMIVHGNDIWDDGLGWMITPVDIGPVAYFSDDYAEKMSPVISSLVPNIGPYVGSWKPYGLDATPFHGLDALLNFYDPNDEWAFRVTFFGEGSIDINYLALHLCLVGEGDIQPGPVLRKVFRVDEMVVR